MDKLTKQVGNGETKMNKNSSRFISLNELITAMAVGVVAFGSLVSVLFDYVDTYRSTGEYNYFEQKEARNRRKILYSQVFGQQGLADLNNDGVLSFEEKVHIYLLMGYEFNELPEQGKTGFPIPTTSQLEKVVDHYKNNLNYNNF